MCIIQVNIDRLILLWEQQTRGSMTQHEAASVLVRQRTDEEPGLMCEANLDDMCRARDDLVSQEAQQMHFPAAASTSAAVCFCMRVWCAS